MVLLLRLHSLGWLILFFFWRCGIQRLVRGWMDIIVFFGIIVIVIIVAGAF